MVVEDDLNLGFLLVELLEAEGYSVKLCKDGAMGLKAIQRDRFDLCLLDVTMPIMDGFELAAKIRGITPDTPFLFLTARTRKEDKLKGYAFGAEDYLLKPFDEDELLCKIKVILRRQTDSELQAVVSQPGSFQIGSHTFDYARQELRKGAEIYRLTEKENEVLKLLCLNQNNILRRDEAVEKIYGRRDYFLGRSFDVFISRLRKLLKEDPAVSIENVFGVGFMLQVKDG